MKLELLWDIHELLEKMTVKKLRKVLAYARAILYETDGSEP